MGWCGDLGGLAFGGEALQLDEVLGAAWSTALKNGNGFLSSAMEILLKMLY